MSRVCNRTFSELFVKVEAGKNMCPLRHYVAFNHYAAAHASTLAISYLQSFARSLGLSKSNAYIDTCVVAASITRVFAFKKDMARCKPPWPSSHWPLIVSPSSCLKFAAVKSSVAGRVIGRHDAMQLHTAGQTQLLPPVVGCRQLWSKPRVTK